MNEEDKKELSTKLTELFNYHDEKVKSNDIKNFHHGDIVKSFLPWIKSTLSKEEQAVFFDCNENDLFYFTNEFIDLLRFNQVKSFSRSFQLFDYVSMFRKRRNWTRIRREMAHLRGGFWSRLRLKKQLKQRLGESNSSYLPLSGGLKGTLVRFLDSLPRQRDATGKLTLKPFHGGNRPDVLDILVCGAIQPCKKLDMYQDMKEVPKLEQWLQTTEDEIGQTSCHKEE